MEQIQRTLELKARNGFYVRHAYRSRPRFRSDTCENMRHGTESGCGLKIYGRYDG